MHLDLAIEKLTERNKLDRLRAKQKVTKTQIAAEAGVAVPTVCQYFKGRIDSDRIDAAVKKLLHPQ